MSKRLGDLLKNGRRIDLVKLVTHKADVFSFTGMGNVLRDEAHTAVKSILYKYVFMTNIIAGCIGFALGLIVMFVVR